MRLVVASRNAHKLAELGALLRGHELIALPAHVTLPPEDGETFVDNALGKARAAAAQTGCDAIADDSGLVAAALGGRPGVRSARFAGPQASDGENTALLLASAPVGSELAYVCALALVRVDGTETVVQGRCEGTLASGPQGQGGFGYDPVFIAADDPAGRTMAELSAAEKAAISHRGRAARVLAAQLGRV